MARRMLLIIGGTGALVVILSIIGIFVVYSRANATSTTPTPTTIAAMTVTPTPTSPYIKVLKQYGPTLKNLIAQGLKLTPDQLTTQLQAGKSLSAVATAQGLSKVQVQTLIAGSLQSSLNPAITSGNLTQKQVSTLIKRWQKNPKSLERLLGARIKKSTPVTPTS